MVQKTSCQLLKRESGGTYVGAKEGGRLVAAQQKGTAKKRCFEKTCPPSRFVRKRLQSNLRKKRVPETNVGREVTRRGPRNGGQEIKEMPTPYSLIGECAAVRGLWWGWEKSSFLPREGGAKGTLNEEEAFVSVTTKLVVVS